MFYSWASLLVLPSLLRLPILLSLSLSLSPLVASLGGHSCSHLLWWPLLCCLRGISFCSSSAVSSSSYSCYRCCQLLAEPPWCVCSAGLGTPAVFPLGVLWLAALLGFPCWLFLYAWQAVREALLFLLSIWWSSALQGCWGGGGGAPSSGPSGFRRWVPSPFRRLSVPPLAGLEGQGCGALGCRGAAGGLLSALPQHSSSFRCSHPNAFFQPHLHQGGCSGGGHLGLHCQGCCGPYPLTSPDFYSRLFVVWKTSGSWRPVIDLSHLIRFVDVSPFRMGTIQSVLLSVRKGDWMDSIDLMEAYLQVPVSSSFSSLSSLHVP